MTGPFIFLLMGILALADANDCPDCWERCFPLDKEESSFKILFNLINKIRGMKVAYNIKCVLNFYLVY